MMAPNITPVTTVARISPSRSQYPWHTNLISYQVRGAGLRPATTAFGPACLCSRAQRTSARQPTLPAGGPLHRMPTNAESDELAMVKLVLDHRGGVPSKKTWFH